MKYAAMVNAETTPQTEALLGEAMILNDSGGYVYEISYWKRLQRFLILGSDEGTYYSSAKKLTLENVQVLLDLLAINGKAVVGEIVRVSTNGLAVKNDPAIFALAVATKFGDPQTRSYAFDHLKTVCRTGTHLFQFAEARKALGAGWGRGARTAVGKWYSEMGHEALAMQLLKYRQREGWEHRDLLRLSHPKVEKDSAIALMFDAVCRPEKWDEVANHSVGSSLTARGYVAAQKATSVKEVVDAISTYKIPREFIPTQFLNEKEVWEALLVNMPMTAMIRNLGNMSKSGLLVPMSAAAKYVAERLTNQDLLRKARVHPFSILLAARTYAQGKGVRGKSEWNVVPQVEDALDKAFNLSFTNVVPTGKRYLLGVDVSSSMSWGGGVLTAAEAAAAMALITARVEENYHILGFTSEIKPLGITARDTLTTVMEKTRDQNFGGTDTSLAIKWALDNDVNADVVMIYTDNATWAGDMHTSIAMKKYREKTGLPVKLGVVAFTATNNSISKQNDPLSMDFVGLDASLPAAISAFVDE